MNEERATAEKMQMKMCLKKRFEIRKFDNIKEMKIITE